jgi:hypothetical protein
MKNIMNIKKSIMLLGIFWGILNIKYATGFEFHGSASNSVYSVEDTSSHTRLFQYVRFSLKSQNLSQISLNASLRALTDLDQTLDSEDRFKAYLLNIKARKLFNRIDLTVGRQFLHPGTILGGLDGAYAKVGLTSKMDIALYSGAESHFQRSFKIYKAEDSFVLGGLFNLSRFYASTLQLLYLQKANEEDTFWQLTGLNLYSALLPKTDLRVQAHYDLQNSRIHRLLVNARYEVSKKLQFSAGFKNQHPQIYANSFFTIFEVEAYQQYKLGAACNIFRNCFLSGQYQLIQFETENANRLIMSLGNMNGNIGLIYESGYAGEQLGFLADYAYSITPELVASLNVNYSKYKTEKIYEFESQIANALRLSYEFKHRFSVDIEYQWLTNRFKDSDSRFLNHIHYRW